MPTTAPLLSSSVGAAPPWTADGIADPRPWFAEALESERVVHDPRAGLWHIFRHEDVRDFLRQPDVWSTAKRMERVDPSQRIVRLLTSDPPNHTALRHHFNHAYRPRRIAAMEPSIRRRAGELIDHGLATGSLDVVADLAVPLTREVIGELIGVRGEDLEECARLAIRNPLGTTEDGPDGEPVPIIWMGAGEPENNRHFDAYFRTLIDERRLAPKDDLVTALAGIALAPSTTDGVLNLGALLDEQFGAGQNTTVHLIGTLLHSLLERPDDLARLRADRSLVPAAVEEGLRWTAPLQARPRISTRPVTIGTTEIPANAIGLAWSQAANLDPRRFDDSLEFRLDRTDNAHLSFGFGEHFCLGAALARLEVRVAMEEWLARVGACQRLEDGPPAWIDSYMLRGLRHLRVAVEPILRSPGISTAASS